MINANAKFGELQALFGRVIQMPETDRIRFLREIEDSDPSIANELCALVQFSEQSPDPLEEYCQQRRAVSDENPGVVESELPVVAGYSIERLLEKGGQAKVFLAHQQSTGQAVAIKVFQHQVISENQRSHIYQETEALVRLQLPNVVPILDCGETSCGKEYLVTRFISGQPVDKVAANWRSNDAQRVIELFIKIARTLAKVHRQGLIHRDLKPSNVLVDDSGEPYLLDFGLSSFFAAPCGRPLTETIRTGFEGTVRWASPEQVDPSFGRIDHRSDLYSLGVMLYEALTGRFPYAASGGFVEIAQQIVRAQPLPLLPTGSDSAQLSADIVTVVMQLLEKRPARRFQSADKLIEALQAAQPVSGAVPTSLRRSRSEWTWSAAAGAAMLLAAAVWAGRQPAPSSSVVQPEQHDPLPAAIEVSPAPPYAAQPPPPPPPEKIVATLAPFGETPEGWQQLGSLQNDWHAIERQGLTLQGDFRIRLNLAAARTDQAQVVLTLVGDGAADDLKITARKTNTWSDNEMWYFHTPAGESNANLPIGGHALTLDREGERVSLSVDIVAGSGDTRLATFAIDADARFRAVRLATSGPALELRRLRIDPLKTAQQ